jgi:hypothetical protein
MFGVVQHAGQLQAVLSALVCMSTVVASAALLQLCAVRIMLHTLLLQQTRSMHMHRCHMTGIAFAPLHLLAALG